MPKKPIGDKAMTPAERQSKFREDQKKRREALCHDVESLRNETKALKAELVLLRDERNGLKKLLTTEKSNHTKLKNSLAKATVPENLLEPISHIINQHRDDPEALQVLDWLQKLAKFYNAT